MLEVLLERLEADQDMDMVRFSMSAVAVSRNGLLESEMVELLYDIEKKESLDFAASFSQLYATSILPSTTPVRCS